MFLKHLKVPVLNLPRDRYVLARLRAVTPILCPRLAGTETLSNSHVQNHSLRSSQTVPNREQLPTECSQNHCLGARFKYNKVNFVQDGALTWAPSHGPALVQPSPHVSHIRSQYPHHQAALPHLRKKCQHPEAIQDPLAWRDSACYRTHCWV